MSGCSMGHLTTVDNGEINLSNDIQNVFLLAFLEFVKY